jgi:hypothetical protein
MDPVMVWNLICFAAFGVSVAVRQLPEHEPLQPKTLEAWLIEARSQDMGITGYQDPIYSEESKPMELQDDAAAAQK